jgi:hypothetical protein
MYNIRGTVSEINLAELKKSLNFLPHTAKMQRHLTENTNIPVSDLYISRIGLSILLQENI